MAIVHRSLRGLLVVLVVFLAITAVPGGVALLVGAYAPPSSMLRGSAFSDFTVPALTLIGIVGGGAGLAAVLLVRGSRFALSAACLAGAAVMSFEFVQVLVIGSPAGPAHVMQVLYFSLGLSIIGISQVLTCIEAGRQLAATAARTA